jgi:hypothetical protein
MKIAILNLVLVLFVIGCSKKDNAVTPAQFTLGVGDITSPVEVITNGAGAITNYSISVEFSSSEQSRFREFEQQHLNQDIQILAGSEVLMGMQHIQGISSPVTFKIPYASSEEAQAMADALNKVSEK